MGWLWQECVCVCVLCIRTIVVSSSLDTWCWYGFGCTCCDDSWCGSTLKPHRSIPDPNTTPVAFAFRDGRVVFPLHPPPKSTGCVFSVQPAGWKWGVTVVDEFARLSHFVVLKRSHKINGSHAEEEKDTLLFSFGSMIYYWDVLLGSGWASVSSSSLSPRDVYISWNSHRRREQLQSDP